MGSLLVVLNVNSPLGDGDGFEVVGGGMDEEDINSLN